MLNEAKQRERTELVRESHDHIQSIMKRWICVEALCSNTGKWCYVDPPTQRHFAIKPNDMETWANKIVESTPSVAIEAPPASLIEYFKRTPDMLRVNPHNRRLKRHLAKDKEEEDNLKKLKKTLAKRKLRDKLIRMEEDAEERDLRREELKANRERQRLHQGSHTMAAMPSYPFSYPGMQLPGI